MAHQSAIWHTTGKQMLLTCKNFATFALQHWLLLLLYAQAKEVPGAAVGNGWATEFDAEQEATAHEDVWKQFSGVSCWRLCICRR